MKFILILITLSNTHSPPGAATAEFNSLRACLYAMEEMKRLGGIRAVCLPKGLEGPPAKVGKF